MTLPRQLLIATTNPGKRAELARFLKSWPVKLRFLDEFKIRGRPRENGATFSENALIKARFYARAAGLPALADDGGLEIEALNGEPGVKSRRWPGYEAGDEELIDLTLKKLRGLPLSKRRARLVVVTALADPAGRQTVTARAFIEGLIAEKPLAGWIRGYPYRALFVIRDCNQYYDRLGPEEHERINHRKKALAALFKKLSRT